MPDTPDVSRFRPPSWPELMLSAYRGQMIEALDHGPAPDRPLLSTGFGAGYCLTITVTPVPDDRPAPGSGEAAASPGDPPPAPVNGRSGRGRRPGRCPAGIIVALRDGPLTYAELLRALPDCHENTVKSNLRRLMSEGYVTRLDGRYTLPDD